MSQLLLDQVTSFVRLMRPHQYVKNGFVFIGVIYSGEWHQTSMLWAAALAFSAFSFMASAVYVFNDIFDAEADRAHPVKCMRPLAHRRISIHAAWWFSGCLALIALALSLLISPWAGLLLVLYALLNAGYSLRWKHVAVLDVFVIASGFMLRILVGTLGLGIQPSSWLLLTGLMVTLFLGFAKRRAELIALEHAGIAERRAIRRALDDYNPKMIDQFMAITAACTILTYSLYTVSVETVARHGTDTLIYTVPLVIYGIFRYEYLLHRQGKGNDAARDLLSDRQLLITVALWVTTTLAILA